LTIEVAFLSLLNSFFVEGKNVKARFVLYGADDPHTVTE